MITHFLIAGNSLFSQIRCKVKTFSTISSINSQKLLLFAANLSFLLTFLQEYAENWRKIVAIAFGSSKEECKHPHKKYQEIVPWIICWKIELSLLMSHNHPQRVLAILAQPMFHVEGILAMGILHQALQGILLAMRQATRMQEFMDCYFP